jgi:hypothetical protein
MERKEYGEERETKPARSKFMVSNASSISNEMQRVSFLVRVISQNDLVPEEEWF